MPASQIVVAVEAFRIMQELGSAPTLAVGSGHGHHALLCDSTPALAPVSAADFFTSLAPALKGKLTLAPNQLEK
jgi:hypothetical protein